MTAMKSKVLSFLLCFAKRDVSCTCSEEEGYTSSLERERESRDLYYWQMDIEL